MAFLAVDVGGTSTRAAIVDENGTCFGYGTAGSGNPTSSGTASAVSAIIGAWNGAIAQAGSVESGGVVAGVVGIAGASGETGEWLRGEVVRAGLPERLTFAPDLLVAYVSGSLASNGYALIAGTGAAAVRIRGGDIEATRDGLGWLLGDAGSGFWIGHRAVRAAMNALDEREPSTVLVDLVASQLGIARTAARGPEGRPVALRRAVDALYRMRPVELARFAPLVFEAAAEGDDVAGVIVREAGEALAATLAAVVVSDITGPLVLSGSILSQPSIAERVVRSFRGAAAGAGGRSPVVTVSDGTAGAAVLALRQGGVVVDEAMFARVQSSLAARR